MPTTLKSTKIKLRLNKKEVKRALIDREWSQYDLAAAIGKDVSTVNRAINRGQFPKTMELIADILRIKLHPLNQ